MLTVSSNASRRTKDEENFDATRRPTVSCCPRAAAGMCGAGITPSEPENKCASYFWKCHFEP
jgi:hypothetical protein